MADANTASLEGEAIALLTDQVVNWLKTRFDQSGASTLVLGLSGGLDSAVVYGLCARAVGPDRVLGVIMPSASNPDDAESALLVARAFGGKAMTVDLTAVAQSLYDAIPFDGEPVGAGSAEPENELAVRQRLAIANARPRLRMTTLYFVANLMKGLVVGTSNKTEWMIGYFTKHGDSSVDLFPLIDFYKYEVRAIARHIGVPTSVIDRPPSAGLWPGQTDEGEIGLSYDVLDRTLEAIARGDTAEIEPHALDRVNRLMTGSAHKRTPGPAFHRIA